MLFASFNVYASSFIIDVTKNTESSTGMGFFIQNDGTGMTAYHVVQNADSISIKTEKQSLPAKIIGFDEVLDVAIIKTDFVSNDFNGLTNIMPVNIVISIENIFGNIINRSLNYFTMDIDIYEGLSGSPVMCGQGVCGVVTSFEKNTNNAIATRASAILKKYDQLLSGGKFKKKVVDFYVTNPTKELLTILEMDVNEKNGVLVTKTKNQLLQTWDIITHINNKPVSNVEALQRIFSEIYEDELTKLQIIRDKKKYVIEF